MPARSLRWSAGMQRLTTCGMWQACDSLHFIRPLKDWSACAYIVHEVWIFRCFKNHWLFKVLWPYLLFSQIFPYHALINLQPNTAATLFCQEELLQKRKVIVFPWMWPIKNTKWTAAPIVLSVWRCSSFCRWTGRGWARAWASNCPPAPSSICCPYSKVWDSRTLFATVCCKSFYG